MHTLIYMHSVTVFFLNFKDNGDYFNITGVHQAINGIRIVLLIT